MFWSNSDTAPGTTTTLVCGPDLQTTQKSQVGVVLRQERKQIEKAEREDGVTGRARGGARLHGTARVGAAQVLEGSSSVSHGNNMRLVPHGLHGA